MKFIFSVNSFLKCFWIVLFLCASVYLYSQKTYSPGFIIRNDGEKINGYILNRDLEKNPSLVSFKSSPESPIENYSPLQIKKFGVEDELYVSAVVEAETSLYADDRKLTYSSEMTFRTDTAFLEAIVEGTKSLYYYMDKTGRITFYIGKDNSFEQLIIKRYKKDIEERLMVDFKKTVVVNMSGYKQQLVSYLGDCQPLYDRLQDTKYELRYLIDIFSEYYKNCSASPPLFIKSKNKNQIETGIIAGGGYVSLKFTHEQPNHPFQHLTGAKISGQSFAGGLYATIYVTRKRGKWSIANELFFTYYSAKGTYNDFHNPEYYVLHNITFSYGQAKLNCMARYKFLIRNTPVFLNLGITNALEVSEINRDNVEDRFYSTTTFEKKKALDFTKPHEFGFLGGISAQLKRYSIHLRWENGNGMSEFPALKSRDTRVSFFIGYQF